MRNTKTRLPSSPKQAQLKQAQVKETDRFIVLSRIIERLRGMKGIKKESSHVVLVPCCDIHTFGMKAPLDVAFIDKTGTVIAVHRRVMPKRRIRNAAARLVVERAAHQGAWYECGDNFFRLPLYVSKEETELCSDCQE